VLQYQACHHFFFRFSTYREEVERLYRGGANTVGKQHFTSLYSRARDVAFTPRNIKSGWAKAGLFPFDPNKVLKDIKKPEIAVQGPQLDNAIEPPQSANAADFGGPEVTAQSNRTEHRRI